MLFASYIEETENKPLISTASYYRVLASNSCSPEMFGLVLHATGWEFYSHKSFLFILTYERFGGKKESYPPEKYYWSMLEPFFLVFLSLLDHKSQGVYF